MTATAAPRSPPVTYSGVRLLLITVALVLGPLVQVFDTATVSIALRSMQGELSATQDQIAWVVTSYLITLTVFTPLWGVLGGMFGRKRLILGSIVGFTTAAMLSGSSTSLNEILVWRAVQGFFGSALLPLGMSSLLSVYPREKLGVAMAWWGVGMMFGPMFGPTIGGYVTEYLTWRWAFFINLPIGIVAFLMTAFFVPRTGVRQYKKFNYFAFITLGVSIASLQFILDRGERYDWFDSPMIITIMLIGLAAFWLFLVNVFTTKTPFIEPVLFKDRDYLAGTVLRTLFGVIIFGSLVLMPPFIQDIGGYPPLLSGYSMAPRGAGTMIASFLVGYMLPYFDPRKLIAVSMVVIAATMWQLSTFTEDIDMTVFVINNFIQGLGLRRLHGAAELGRLYDSVARIARRRNVILFARQQHRPQSRRGTVLELSGALEPDLSHDIDGACPAGQRNAAPYHSAGALEPDRSGGPRRDRADGVAAVEAACLHRRLPAHIDRHSRVHAGAVVHEQSAQAQAQAR